MEFKTRYFTALKGVLTFFLDYQLDERPRFKLVRRWKQYKGTYEIGLILNGYWIGCLIDHDFLCKD